LSVVELVRRASTENNTACSLQLDRSWIRPILDCACLDLIFLEMGLFWISPSKITGRHPGESRDQFSVLAE